MTQKEKDLLLYDLSARLPYYVNVEIKYSKEHGSSLRLEVCSEGMLPLNTDLLGLFQEEEIYLKPYLRPMSSMTKEERHEIQGILGKDIEIIDDFINIIDSSRKRFSFLELQAVFDWLNAYHFDYRGLIEKGLALEATTDMYHILE